jgi:hypothetical protein
MRNLPYSPATRGLLDFPSAFIRGLSLAAIQSRE